MPAKLIEQKNNKITIQFTFELTGQMLKEEQSLQQSLNEAGQAAMVPMIKQFDTNGEPVHYKRHNLLAPLRVKERK